VIRELSRDDLAREAPELAAWIADDDGDFTTAFAGPKGVYVVFETSAVFLMVVVVCTLRNGVVRKIEQAAAKSWELDDARAVAQQLAAGELLAHDLERSSLVVTRSD